MRGHVTLLAALALAVIALAQPKLIVTSAAVVGVEELGEGTDRTYILTVELPPLTKLHEEKLACLYRAEVKSVAAQYGTAVLRAGCILLTSENPTARTVRVAVTVEAAAVTQLQQEQPSILLAAVTAAAAAASYFTLSETGRGKLFSALSIPVAYYVTKRSDVARSPKRVKILEYIKANPGASMRRIARETGISYGEVQWHLSILERLGLVEWVRVGKYTCYYPAGTPVEIWLTRFAETELKLDSAALDRLRQTAQSRPVNHKELTELLDL